jgi:3-oxoacyl-[acyl-carrier protein] reductase
MSRDMPDLKVAVVTGAAGVGIGQAVARRLAGRGMAVAVTDLSAARAADVAAAIGAESTAATLGLGLDVSDAAAVTETIGRVESEWGRVDVLVNSAGFAQTSPFTELDPAAWRRTFEVNVTGTFLVTRSVVPMMLAQGSGAIVNVASFRALRARDNTAYCAYAASKAAVIGLTQALAAELGPAGIRCNAVAPGTIINPRLAGARPPGFFDQQRDASPLRRLGQPGDVADVVAFLSGPESSFMTGETLYVTGGL